MSAPLLDAAFSSLRRRRDTLLVPGSPAEEVARRIGRTIPLVYGSTGVTAVAARRWKTQINENAKTPAFFAVQPELSHNEVAGWGQHGDVTRQVFSLITLRHDGEHPHVARRFELVVEATDEVMANVIPVWAEGDEDLARFFDLALFGDLVSLHMAGREGIDPGPVPALSDVESAFARLTGQRGGPSPVGTTALRSAVVPPLRSSQPADLQRALEDGPNTVTQVLEQLTGESIVAEVAGQYTIAAESANALDLATGQPITHRIAVLKGGTSRRPYLYAESIFAPERLPWEVRARLERTSDPIGRILLAHGFSLAREALPPPEQPDPPPAASWRGRGAEIIWARAYVLLLNDLPVFAIGEWFFRSVLEALDRTA